LVSLVDGKRGGSQGVIEKIGLYEGQREIKNKK
jgi:hypothetical protein